MLRRHDGTHFYDWFNKDLRLFGRPLSQVIHFDDSIQAVPKDQQANLLYLARPDVNEDLMHLKGRDSGKYFRAHDEMDGVQIARTRYRLVRATGILSAAVRLFRRGQFRTLPEAISYMQWAADANKSYLVRSANMRNVYEEGMRVLKSTYERYLKPNHPAFPRSENYFTLKSVELPTADCNADLRGSSIRAVPYL
jgi:hypothetical protein